MQEIINQNIQSPIKNKNHPTKSSNNLKNTPPINYSITKKQKNNSFNTKAPRFQQRQSSYNPSPTSYDTLNPIKLLDKHSFHQQSPKLKLQNSPDHKQFHWIIDQNQRSSFIPSLSSSNKYVGPGTYEYQNYFNKNKINLLYGNTGSHYIQQQGNLENSVQLSQNGSINNNNIIQQKSSWSKQERFHQKSQENQNRASAISKVGPGSYDYSESYLNLKGQKSCAASAFKSKVAKSFLQQLYEKQERLRSKTFGQNLKNNSGFIQNSNYEINYNLTNENKGQNQQDEVNDFQNGKDNKQKYLKNKSSVFASNVRRFAEPNKFTVLPSNIGPGTYEVDYQKLPKQKLPRIITIKQSNRTPKPKPKVKPLPGPCSYDTKNGTIAQQIINKGNTSFTSKQQRFSQPNALKQKRPGPGQYNQNRFIYMVDLNRSGLSHFLTPHNKQQINLNDRISSIKGSFLSNTQRPQLILNSKDNPFGNYNIDNYSLQYRLKKKRQHLQKLKIMQVDVPAFNTKQKR